MPHIHNDPDQHDITVSGWIVRNFDGEWRCLVHFHKKIERLMQIGGHIELNETPWQSIAHEMSEEAGYDIGQLAVLQPVRGYVTGVDNVIHPIPVAMNTHYVGSGHYHSDMCFAFVADADPTIALSGDESDDLRWATLDELKNGAASGSVLNDVPPMYEYVIRNIDQWNMVKASEFSLEKPKDAAATYLRGAAGQ